MKLIFVGGFYGVGKTTLCSAGAQRLGIEHRSASALIREMDPSSIPLQGKAVADLDANQRLLIASVRQLEKTVSTMLLDGHYAIAVKERGFEAIPPAVFSALRPMALVHVSGSADAIYQQLVARDGTSAWDKDVVSQLQRMDLDQARTVSAQLGIPLRETNLNEQEEFIGWLATAAC